MLLTNNDIYRILRHLSFPYSKMIYLKEQIELVSVEGEDYEGQILSLLFQLDSIEAKIAEEKTSINSALIRADVLEWETGGKRTWGMSQEYGKLRLFLANFLDISLSGTGLASGGSVIMEVIV